MDEMLAALHEAAAVSNIPIYAGSTSSGALLPGLDAVEVLEDADADPVARRWPLWGVAAAVAILLVGFVVVWLLRTAEPTLPPHPAISPRVASEPGLAPADAVAPEPEPIVLHFETQPPGAKVLLGDSTLCPATPCEVPYNGDAATEVFTLDHPDYAAKDVERPLEAGRNDIRVSLLGSPKAAPKSPPKPVKAVAKPAPTPKAHKVVKPAAKKPTPKKKSKYKENPY
jgi:hypothetical protein